jgi:hypothetical protein
MRAATPDWRALELELPRLVRSVEEVALAAGCSPQTVADAIAETLDDDTHPPRRPELHLAGDDRRT